MTARYANPLLAAPTRPLPRHVAILGAGRIDARPAVHDGALAVRRLLPLSLTFDHRAVTGGEAARFLAAAIAELEKPE